MKIGLAIVAVCVLFVGGLIVAAGYWFEQNKEQLRAKGIAMEQEASAFGEGHDNQACLEESQARLGTCADGALSDVVCKAMAKMFLKNCLPASQPTPGFCEGVPTGDGIIDGALWAVQRCESQPEAKREGCARHMQVMRDFCSQSQAQ